MAKQASLLFVCLLIFFQIFVCLVRTSCNEQYSQNNVSEVLDKPPPYVLYHCVLKGLGLNTYMLYHCVLKGLGLNTYVLYHCVLKGLGLNTHLLYHCVLKGHGLNP